MFMLWYWETKSIIQVQRRYFRENGEQTPGRPIKRWLKQIKGIGSVLHKKGAGTVVMVREAFQRSPSKSFGDYVKDQVFRSKVGSVLELRARINSTVASVIPQMLENAWREIE
jgi:hypothetical protein